MTFGGANFSVNIYPEDSFETFENCTNGMQFAPEDLDQISIYEPKLMRQL